VLALVVVVVGVICIGVGMDIVESVMGGLGVEFCCAYNSQSKGRSCHKVQRSK
jgi:hypothetical protein